jgi:uncharacterized protein
MCDGSLVEILIKYCRFIKLPFLMMLLLPLQVFSASFECSKSYTFIEHAICGDKRLSKLDDQLGNAYQKAIQAASAPDEVKVGQQNWLDSVRNVCQDKECLKNVYEARLKALGPGPTDTYNFVGTSWRSPSSYNDVIEFREGGVVAFKSERGFSYGQWKVENGVLRFDNNNYSHFEAKIDGDWLTGNSKNSGNSWSIRWYRTDNEKIDKSIKKDFDQSIEDFRNAIETLRQSVLSESPETEAMLQNGKGEQYGGKHWLSLCDGTMAIKAISIAASLRENRSELCYNWYGTRHDWKETILKEGCKGQCRP